MSVVWCACKGQRTVSGSWFSPSTVWVPGEELRTALLVTKYFYLLSHLSSSSEGIFSICLSMYSYRRTHFDYRIFTIFLIFLLIFSNMLYSQFAYLWKIQWEFLGCSSSSKAHAFCTHSALGTHSYPEDHLPPAAFFPCLLLPLNISEVGLILTV